MKFIILIVNSEMVFSHLHKNLSIIEFLHSSCVAEKLVDFFHLEVVFLEGGKKLILTKKRFFYILIDFCFSFDEISGAHSTTGTKEEPLISDKDKTDFMNLANENISMDFILEMREAFQLFDKVK